MALPLLLVLLLLAGGVSVGGSVPESRDKDLIGWQVRPPILSSALHRARVARTTLSVLSGPRCRARRTASTPPPSPRSPRCTTC